MYFFLCLCYKVAYNKFYVAQKMNCYSHILCILNKTCICVHHQQSPIATCERVFRSHYLWAVGWAAGYMIQAIGNDATSIK